MKKEKTVKGKVVACAFVLLTVLAMFAGVVPLAAATTWYVDDSGGADFMSIQDAVDAAGAEDIIIVYPGTYTENVKVNTDYLTIKSENGADSTIVQAANTNDHVFWITTDYVNISGFTAKGATGTYKKAGFYLRYGDHCNISSNTANENDLGIYLYGSYDNTISDNTANNNDIGIINVYNSNNNAIFGNTANENTCSILLSNSTDNTVSDNTANNNNNYGIELYCSYDNTVSSNTANENNDNGIRSYNSSGNTVSDNTVNNNDYSGIYLWLSNDNTVSGNTVNENYYHGIYLHYSDSNTVSSNTANDNGYRGIYLHYSDNNIIILNNFINNEFNAHTYSSINIWNSQEQITYTHQSNTYINYLGNYWDDYTDTDSDGDGIWDNPYNIDSDKDNYPLVEPWENYIEQPPSLNGKIVFHTNRDNNFEIYIMDADGTNQTRITRNAGNDHYAVWSPDGAKIAFTSEKDGNEEIYVMNPNGTNQNRLTYNSTSDWVPDFSPDGKKVAFTSNRDGNSEVYIMNSEGGNQTRLTENNADDRDPDWSITNKIAFESNRDGNPEIYLMDADGNNVIRLTHNSAVDRHPAWSSDGSKIVFTSDRDGNDEIYVMNADGSNQMRVTYNSASDLDPVWSPDGNYFVFATNRTGNYEIYRMDTDGSNQTRLTVNTNEDYRPDWGLPASIPNYPPNPPTNLAQFKSDSTTEIPVGGTTDEQTVSFKGTVSDPDSDMVKLQVELRRLDEYGGQFDETKGGLKDSDFVASGSEAVAYAIELIDADYHWRARTVDEHGDSSAWQEFGGNDISGVDFGVIQTLPSGTINVILYGYVDDATQDWNYPTKYNAPVFRRGVDNLLFMLTLDGQLPSNYECLYEIYSPNGASPIGSKRSSSFCCWEWTDIKGNPLNKDQIPIGIYTVNGYLVNRNNPEDKKFIGFDEFFVIFDFEEKDESFVTMDKEWGYFTDKNGTKYPRPPYELNSYKPEIWKTAVEWTNGAVTTIEAVEKISELARSIDGKMVFHQAADREQGFFLSDFRHDKYDNDFDTEIDESDEAWKHNYQPCNAGPNITGISDSGYIYELPPELGKAYYNKTSWTWGIPPIRHDQIWVDGKGNEYDNHEKADRISWYFDTLEMLKEDFDPDNKVPEPYQHSLGVCEDYAMLTVGYIRAIGIPSRVVTAEKDGNDGHAAPVV